MATAVVTAGALGAVVGELSAQFYGDTDPGKAVAFAQMMGGIAAAAAGLGAEGVSIAANTGANAAQNNYLNHAQIEALGSAWAQCKTLDCKQQLIKQYKALSNENDKALEFCTSFNCVAGHLAAIRQADSALASAYQLDPTGQLGQTINNWQSHAQTVIAPFTANQQHLITSRKDTLVLYMNQYCRGVSANACATQMLQNEATSKAIGELAYMAAMFTPLGVIDDTKTLATGQNLTGEDSSRLLAVLGVLTAGESSALGKAVEKAGGLVKAAKAAVSDSPEALKLTKELEDVNKAGGAATKGAATRVAEQRGWKPATELTPSEANKLLDQSLPSGVKIDNIRSADTVNASARLKGYDDPLITGTNVVEITTTQSTHFVRVFSEGSRSEQTGSWVMRADDIAGLTPSQIASKYSLPQTPDMITDVTIPAGTKMQVSVANNILKGANGGGGGVQFQIGSIPDPDKFAKWFSNVRPLK